MLVASIRPLTDPVSAMVISETNTLPLIKPEISIDPDVHYIVKSVEVNEEKHDSTVNHTIQNGYRRGNRLLRKATVVSNVYKGDNNE